MTAPTTPALRPVTVAKVLEELKLQILTPAGGGALRAITLHQPWAWAILHAGKTVENRTWPLARWATGKWIALHAGAPQRTEADDAEWIRTTFGLHVPANTGRGLVGLVKFGMPRPPVARRTQPEHQWEFGPWCWPITDRLALPSAIPIRGAQGFWVVPPGPPDQILEQLARVAGGEARSHG